MLPFQWLTLLLFLICLCVSTASGESNFSLTNVLECDVSSLDSPPDLSSNWVSNVTETCLYVTIQDQFGDGWGNNTSLFYWAQVGNQDSNIISVGLDCENDCGTIKTGCLRPLNLAGEDEHFFHLTVVAIDAETQLTIPDYFWEMQWSVQVVKGDDWREKYYGGINSSMVFNYNRDADDLTLAWSENLWQYPPAAVACSSTTSADKFFNNVYGDNSVGHQSYNYGFTANDAYFPPSYSVVSLPEKSMELFGWLSCLTSDDPVSLLYRGSFAFRSSAAGSGTSEGAASWSLCGFSGDGSEELGMAISKNNQCSGQYFGKVQDFCVNAVTSFPTNVPTAAPTISEAASFFNSFDSATLVQNAPAFQSESDSNRAIFSYHINDLADFSAAASAWEEFVSNYLASSFDVEFYSYSIWASYLKIGSSTTVEWSESCENNAVSDGLIAPIASTDTNINSAACDHMDYMSSSNGFCKGCASADDFAAQCSDVENEIVSLPTLASCYSNDAISPISKHAVVIEIFLREAVADTVPNLNFFSVMPSQDNVVVTANITTTSTGGKLYCRATETSQGVVSTRASIKSQGVAVPIPPATDGAISQSVLRNVVLGNLYASTEYTVSCFSEDVVGNQMSADVIDALDQTTETLCCQLVAFNFPPSSVKFGVTSSGSAVSPTVFEFSLPRLPAGSVVVTPTFYSQGTDLVVESLTATASSFTFDSSTSQFGTARSFAVSATESGSFYVKLVLSGDTNEVSKYSSTAALFSTREVGAILLPPVLSSARFTDSGGAIILSFAEPTDYGLGAVSYDHTGFWNCSLFLSFIGSEYTACFWQSDSAMVLSLCDNDVCAEVADRKSLVLVVPDDVVTLKAGLMRAKCESTDAAKCQLNNVPASPLSTTVLSPTNPLTPSIFLTASNSGGSCGNDLILDATTSSGAGGRNWADFVWTVSVDSAGEANVTTDMTSSAADIQTTLQTAGDINYPVKIAFALLMPVRYSVSLQLTNFLGETSFSSVFVDLLEGGNGGSSVPSKPSISVDGSSYRKISSFEAFELSISVETPSCVSGENTQYKWSVYRDITYQPQIQSISADPKVMKLDPYALSAGSSYRFQVTVTLESGASDSKIVRVDVVNGSVYVKINGGNKLLLPLHTPWTLDASDSVIEDVSPLAENNAWAPDLSWTCFVAASNTPDLTYGDNCQNILNAAVSAPLSSTVLVPLRTEIMLTGGLYRVTASTYSASGVYVSSTVDIEVSSTTAEQASVVTITSSFRKFNANRILQLYGAVTAPTAPVDYSENVTMSWGVCDSYGVEVDLGSDLTEVFNTPPQKISTIQKIANSIDRTVSFSLSIVPDIFTPGIEYTFKLRAEVGGVETFSSTTLVANSPPSSGKLLVVPDSGQSMSTMFSWSTIYWTDDASDFPLQFTFQYQVKRPAADESSPDSYAVVGLASQKSFLASMLPAGRTSTGKMIDCAVSVADFYEASAMAYAEVMVEVGEENSVEISFANFSASITAAVVRMDWNGVAQDVSNAASLIAQSDCQYSPECDTLMRSSCGPTTPPHTCGDCFSGYVGLIGPSNEACVDSAGGTTAGQAEVGSACSADTDCLYNSCVDALCAYPAKTCPTSNSNVCSGNGDCEFFNDATAQRLVSSTTGEFTTCFANDTSCSARCVCDGGYGKACSLSEYEYRNRSMTRDLICESLQHLIVNQDQSAELANFLATSSAISFDPSEVISPSGITKCLLILDGLTNMSYSGHFHNEALVQSNTSTVVTISTQENFAVLIGAFLDTLAFLNSTNAAESELASEEEWMSLSAAVETGVDAAVTALGRAVSAKMVPGQKSLDVVTGGVRMKVSYDSFADLHSAVLAPPLTQEEKHYGSPLSGIILPASGLSSCSGANNNEETGEDKYARLSVTQWGSNPYSAMNSTAPTTTATNSSAERPDELVSRILRFTPIVSASDAGSTADTVQTDPYTLILQFATEQNWTAAVPGCGRFEEGGAAACPCNVTSYDAYSVILECYNLLDFCPPSASTVPELSTQRHLSIEGHRRHGGDTRHPHYGLTMKQEQRRRLDFDYGGSADDDAAPSGSLLDYGVMFTNLGGEFTSTLSANPYSSLRDLNAALPVLIMMSVLTAIAVGGYMIFDRWDRYDRVYLKYVMMTTANKRYKLPTVLSLKNAFMEKTFVTQKRKSMMTFQDLGSKLRTDKARSNTNSSRPRGVAENSTDLFFDDIYNQTDDSEYIEANFNTENAEGYVPTVETIKNFVRDSDHTADVAQEAAHKDKLSYKVATFFDTALPPTSLLERSNGWTRLCRAMLRHHDWFRVFSFSSLRLPRTIRWLIVVTDVLILLFVDSIFYGVLFPDDGTCSAWDNTNADECMAEPSKFASGSSLCFWDDETSLCEIRPPPTSIEFYMIVAIVVSTFSIVPQAVCHLVLEEVCALEPVFFKHIHKNRSADMHALSDSDSNDGSEGSIELAPSALDEKWDKAKDDYLFKDGIDTKKLYERYAYYDFTTVEEEAGILLNTISGTLENRIKCAPIPWRNDQKTLNGLSAANLEAIMSQLGIHADGSPVELSWRKRVLCGTTPRQRVLSKLKRVRQGVDRIMDDMDSFTEEMEDNKETTLIQHFILEQLTPFKRYALKRQFFQFDCAAPDKIAGSEWLMGWGFIIFVMVFCVWWIFSWALQNGGATMSAWSFEIGFVLLQDTLINDCVQVVLVNVIAIEALRPQLKRIYVILNQILREKIATEKSSLTQEEREKTWDFCVAQHMSAACRAARRPELHYLPFSQVLMRITDYDISQCRDERGIKLSGLVVALLAIPTALAMSNEVVQDTFLDVVLPTAWACFCIAHVYALMLGMWALIVPYALILFALIYRQLVVVPRLRKINKMKALKGLDYKYDSMEDLTWQNMNRQLQLVHLNTLNVTEINPLSMQNNVMTPIRHTPISTKHSPAMEDDISVSSELTGPHFGPNQPSGQFISSEPQTSRRGQGAGSVGGFCEYSGDGVESKYDEVSVGCDESPLGLPPEIMGMHNHAARLQFIQAPVKSKDRSVLGIASVNKLLGLARPTKLMNTHVPDKPQPLPPQVYQQTIHRQSSTREFEEESLEPDNMIEEHSMTEHSMTEHSMTEHSMSEGEHSITEHSMSECEHSISSSDTSTIGPSNPMIEKKGKKMKKDMSTKTACREDVLAALNYDSTKHIETIGGTDTDFVKKKKSPLHRGVELTKKLSDKLKRSDSYEMVDDSYI